MSDTDAVFPDPELLATLGWTPDLATAFAALSDAELVPARVTAVHRAGLVVAGGASGPAALRGDQLAVVGDWVAARPLGHRAAVEHVLPRRGLVARRSAGRASVAQPIAANVDRLIAVTTPDGDFSPRRMERYLAVAWDGGATPLLVLAKIDLVDDPGPFIRALAAVARGVEVLALSARTGAGMDALVSAIGPGITAALVGSSGVGKSTLLNALLGTDRQATRPARAADDKGRHTTTARQLFVLPGGGMVIDTPEMRALGLAGDTGREGLEAAFADVTVVSARCRFRDCSHASEPGCAVVAAVASGALTGARLDAYRALAAEQAYEERRRDRGRLREEKARTRIMNRAFRARARREPKLQDD